MLSLTAVLCAGVPIITIGVLNAANADTYLSVAPTARAVLIKDALHALQEGRMTVATVALGVVWIVIVEPSAACSDAGSATCTSKAGGVLGGVVPQKPCSLSSVSYRSHIDKM